MSSQLPEPDEQNAWKSVHSCPCCGHIVDLAEIGLRAIATGSITCPNCKWVGPVTIKIIKERNLTE